MAALFRSFSEKKLLVIQLFIGFGAGVLLGAAFLHMIPDATEYIGTSLGLPILLGFLTLYLFEKFIMTHPCPAEGCEYLKVGLSAFIGLSFHSFVTGLALGSGILIPNLGFVVFLAVLLHKLPASLSLSSLLVKEKYSNKSITLTILLFSFMVPLGAFITFYLFKNTSHITIGYLIAFSAGTFLHVAADDLIPEDNTSSPNLGCYAGQGYNSIYNVMYDVYSTNSSSISAQYNYWGGGDPSIYGNVTGSLPWMRIQPYRSVLPALLWNRMQMT